MASFVEEWTGGVAVQRALNLKNFTTFTKQVKGARVTEISVSREPGPKGVRLKYRARDPKSGRVFNGEWLVAAAGPAGTAENGGEQEFFALAEKEFAVKRMEE